MLNVYTREQLWTIITFYNNILGLNIVSEFNLENVTEYLDENNFDQLEDMQDAVPEDDAKSDIMIEKYEYLSTVECRLSAQIETKRDADNWFGQIINNNKK